MKFGAYLRLFSTRTCTTMVNLNDSVASIVSRNPPVKGEGLKAIATLVS